MRENLIFISSELCMKCESLIESVFSKPSNISNPRNTFMWSNSLCLVFCHWLPIYLQIKWYRAKGQSIKIFRAISCWRLDNHKVFISSEQVIWICLCLFYMVRKFSFPILYFHVRYSCCLDKKYYYLNMFYWYRKY